MNFTSDAGTTCSQKHRISGVPEFLYCLNEAHGEQKERLCMSENCDPVSLRCCLSTFKQSGCGSLKQSRLAAEVNRAELDSGQPDTLPDHRLRNLNERQEGGLDMSRQVGRQPDSQLKTVMKKVICNNNLFNACIFF